MNKIKKFKYVFLSVLFIVLSVVLFACGNKEEEEKDIELVISGLNPVFIDKDTETFDWLDGVTVSGKESVSEKDIHVVLPNEAHVDGTEVKFDACGDYSIPYYVTDGEGNYSVVSRLVKVRNIYNLYWLNATMPCLYSALDMVTNNYKSMLVFTRKDTINTDILDPERFIYVATDSLQSDLENAKKLTAKIANSDKYSYFRFFCNDAFNEMELFTFPFYGISADRYEVKLVSDGSWTYNTAFPYRDDGSYTLWRKNAEIYNGLWDLALKGEYQKVDGWYYTLTYNGFKAGSRYYTDAECSVMSVIAAQRSNVELWCAYPETLTSKDLKVQAEINKANMPKIAPEKLYEKLTDEQKAEFLKLVNFNKAEFDAKYFDKEGKYIIVTGTNPFNGALTDAEFAQVLDNISKDYVGYNILYKPHPSALAPSDDIPLVKAWFEKNNVKVLPGRLPMEVISWIYSDVAIGGFDSSLFMSVPQGNTQFFICNGADSLSTLTKQLYNDGAFGEVKFYWKES